MASMAKAQEKAASEREARRFERIDLAARSRGISQALLRKFINAGKLTRYKLGTATMIDAAELETLVVADVGNHGPDASVQAKG
jgi:hypothetical protein